MLFIAYGLMRAKSIGIYVGFWCGRVISYIIMIYFGNAVLRPFFEMFEDRITGILLIDGVGIGVIIWAGSFCIFFFTSSLKESITFIRISKFWVLQI